MTFRTSRRLIAASSGHIALTVWYPQVLRGIFEKGVLRMKIAPIALIGIGLTPLLIWLIAFGAIYVVYRRRMKGIERDQQRQQRRDECCGAT